MKRKLIRKGVSLLLLAGMVLSVMIGCGKGEKTDAGAGKRISVTLNEVAHSIFYAPMYVAIEEGYFEEQGIDLTLVTGFGADKTMTAVLTREADIGFMGSEATIYTYAGGTQDYAVNFAQLTQRAGNFLVAREEMVFEYILKKNGLDPKADLTIDQSIDFGSTAAAFSGSDTADFTVEFEPHATALETKGDGYVVASLGEASGYVPYTAFSARKSYIEENPDVIQAFTNALQMGMDYVNSHTPEEIAAVIAPQFEETEVETLERIVKRYYDQDTWKTDLVFEEDAFILLQNILEEARELPERVPYEALVTTEFAEKACK